MFRLLFAVTLLWAFISFETEASITVTLEDISLEVMDEDYFETEYEAYIDDTRRNTFVIHYNILKTLPDNAHGSLEIIGASMGEYVLPTGLDFQLPMCDMLDEPIIMGPFFVGMGFSHENCPPAPGMYGNDGYVLPTDNFPDDFIQNKYMAKFKLFTEDKILMESNILIEVQ